MFALKRKRSIAKKGSMSINAQEYDQLLMSDVREARSALSY
jgi:hypothetical protein